MVYIPDLKIFPLILYYDSLNGVANTNWESKLVHLRLTIKEKYPSSISKKCSDLLRFLKYTIK